jgi:hypothetical protein
MIVKVTETIARAPARGVPSGLRVRNEPQWHIDVLEARLTSNGEVAQGLVFDVKLKPAMVCLVERLPSWSSIRHIAW